jgi:hypothetical protein
MTYGDCIPDKPIHDAAHPSHLGAQFKPYRSSISICAGTGNLRVFRRTTRGC